MRVEAGDVKGEEEEETHRRKLEILLVDQFHDVFDLKLVRRAG